MLYFTSPSITAIPDGNHYVALVTFEANTGHLWTWENFADTAGYGADTGLPIAANTSPSIDTAHPGSGVAAAFQAKIGGLWTWYGYAGTAGSGAPSGYATPDGGVNPNQPLPIFQESSPSID